MKINENYLNLKDSYLFATVGRKTAAYKAAHPEKDVIRLSIGDVTRPLAPAVIEAMHKAVDDMSRAETFHGYGPDQYCYGYDVLIDSIKGSYAKKGVTLSSSEVFVSDGAKSDCGNILDIFSEDNVVLVPDPVYPVYLDTNIMAGRKVIFADATEENGFLPMPDESVRADIIYICSPNNPTGAAYTIEQLKKWVAYAKKRMRSSSMTRRTSTLCATASTRAASTRWRAPRSVPSSCAPIPRLPALRGYAAVTPSCPRRSFAADIP